MFRSVANATRVWVGLVPAVVQNPKDPESTVYSAASLLLPYPAPPQSTPSPLDQGMAPEKELADEGAIKTRGERVLLSSLKEGSTFKFIGKEFRVKRVESGEVTVKDIETGGVRSFKPSLRVMQG